jgi:hypothetical protein
MLQRQGRIDTEPTGVSYRTPSIVNKAGAFVLAVTTLLGFVVLPPRIFAELVVEPFNVRLRLL